MGHIIFEAWRNLLYFNINSDSTKIWKEISLHSFPTKHQKSLFEVIVQKIESIIKYKQMYRKPLDWTRLTSAFVGVGRIAPDEERLVLLKPVVQFNFTYGVSGGFLYICLYFKNQFLYSMWLHCLENKIRNTDSFLAKEFYDRNFFAKRLDKNANDHLNFPSSKYENFTFIAKYSVKSVVTKI